MKLYIAEDEEWIRRGIKKMIRWGELSLELAGEADNGVLAKEEILKLKPDIVLADIRMPGMDGLELVSGLKGMTDTKFLFISGYKEFEYARKAVELNAVSYLLKPVDPEELNEVLHTAVNEIMKERQKELTGGEQNYLLKVLEEQIVPEEEEERFFTVLLMPGDANWITDELHEKFLVVLDSFRNKGMKGELHRKSRDEYVIIFSASTRQAFKLHLKHCLEALCSLIPVKTIWSLGNTVDRMSDIPLSYNQAWQAYIHRPLNYTEGIISYEEMDTTPTFMLPLSEETEKIWAGAVMGEEHKMMQEVDSLFLKVKELDGVGIQNLVDFVFYMVLDFAGRIQKRGVGTSCYYELCQELSGRRFQVKNVQEVKQWLERLLADMCRDLKKEQAKSIQAAVEQISSYIDKHYMEELSLGGMAEMVWLNASYLSSSFKKVKGVNFSDYIMQKRLEKAAELIRNTSLGIGEIAGMVGYDNVKYFSRIFSRMMHMTPSQYRETQKEQ